MVEKFSLATCLGKWILGSGQFILFFMEETKEYLGFDLSSCICCWSCCCTRNGERWHQRKPLSHQLNITTSQLKSSDVFLLTPFAWESKTTRGENFLGISFSARFANVGEFITLFQCRQKNLCKVGAKTILLKTSVRTDKVPQDFSGVNNQTQQNNILGQRVKVTWGYCCSPKLSPLTLRNEYGRPNRPGVWPPISAPRLETWNAAFKVLPLPERCPFIQRAKCVRASVCAPVNMNTLKNQKQQRLVPPRAVRRTRGFRTRIHFNRDHYS